MTITQLLRDRAQRTPERTTFIFLENGERESVRLTLGDLDERASSIAARLQTVTRPGDRAILLFPPGLDFICAFTACLYCGVVAVPAYPPRQNRSLGRLQAIIDDSNPAIALTDAGTLQGLERRSGGYSETLRLDFIPTDGERAIMSGQLKDPDTTPDSLALLQYTSGSTGTPKGVMISHRNILSNMEVIQAAMRHDETSVFVGWLPLFHDMGLFGKVLQPLYLGVPSILMEPAAFVQKPVRWLQAITKYRGTTSGGPDSAYDLCARKIPDSAKDELDLSSWRIAFNGAEPVRSGTLSRFYDAFARCGLRSEALFPVYGLAEATLLATGREPGMPPLIRTVDAERLSRGIVRDAEAADNAVKPQQLVSCGKAWLNHQLRVVNPETGVECARDEIGEIWLAGGSVGSGYWNRDEESERTFRARLAKDAAPYLRTGDLGFLDGEELYVTGRLKDLIIVAGRNHYPQDLEGSAEESDPSLVRNASAAFSVEVDEEERVVLACEVRRQDLRNLDASAVASNVRRALAEEHGIELHALVLLKTSTIARTSSGKIQRQRIRAAYLSGEGLEIAGEWRKPPRAASPSRQSAASVEAWLIDRVARRLGITPDTVDPREPFSSWGLGSIDAVQLSGELEEWMGRAVPPTLIYDFPSIRLLAGHLTRTKHPAAAEADAGAKAGVEAKAGIEAKAGVDAIAIVGMGCRFPGANSPEEFWRLLREGRNAVVEARHRPVGAARAGLLAQVDGFDAEFFGINAREAEAMDPQQRLLLELAWETLENAGIPASSLAGSSTAVAIGISNFDYIRLARGEAAETGPYAATGNALSVAANRISYLLDLRGPSWSVDTACSSSLVAVHQACQALLRGECSAALAGGVNLILSPEVSRAFANSGMLSPDGECRAFDAAANGYVRGEGAGMVLLKRLDDAVRDNDTVFAIIRGSAVNQDGRSNGLTAPNGPAQQAVIREALQAAGVEAREVGYVEAHGTGTPLGDPIEMNSLVAVLGEGRSANDACHVGSVKTNIGHLEAAAGIASLIKTALTLHHREIPPHLHYRSLNPHIALENTPFRIADCGMSWTTSGSVRIAGVSSFGFGGTNVHMILGEASAREDRPAAKQLLVNIVALSARTPEALRALALSYAEYIESHPDVSVQELAFSINAGRSHFGIRATAVAAGLDELRAELHAIAGGMTAHQAPANAEQILPSFFAELLRSEGTARRRMLDRLAQLYEQGAAIDWCEPALTGMERGYAVCRIPLPTYAFQRRRFWLNATEAGHPLLGRRMEPQAHSPQTWTWECALDGPVAEFLRGHRMMGTPVLPYSVYVEMALAAVSQASGARHSSVAGLTLHQPLFLREHEPCTVQTVVSLRPGGEFSFAVYHRAGTPGATTAKWQLCASAVVEDGGPGRR